MPQYIHDNPEDALTHFNFINAYLVSNGAEPGRSALTMAGNSGQSAYVSGRGTSSRLLRSAATPQRRWMIPAPIISADQDR